MKNRIEQLRKGQGMPQQQLASSLGVSRQTIISLENGKYNPSILLAYNIAHMFGLHIEDIFVLRITIYMLKMNARPILRAGLAI